MTKRASALIFASLVALGGCAGASGGNGLMTRALQRAARNARIAGIVPCSAITSIRDLHEDVHLVKNPRTGDTLEYFVLGDGARSKDVLVFFPGTGQIVPDWPTQMLTDSTYSPKIVHALGYRKDEDGPVSLCHDYHLVLFDYPGVGRSPSRTYTRDDVASDVDAMLQRISRTFGLNTATVDPIGWSLGTTFATKYAFLSPASRPTRIIHDVVLIAGSPGGNLSGVAGENSGACVTTLFGASLTATGSLATTIKGDLSKLIFPYQGQGPKQSGTNSGCTATVTSSAVTLSVSLQCTALNNCIPYLLNAVASLKTPPWRATGGIDDAIYTQQRQQSNDWDVATCTTALPGFRSSGCTAFGATQQSITNGGICQTDTSNPSRPRSTHCARLAMSGKLTLLNGFEDLLIQWTYGAAMVAGLNAAHPGSATLHTYPGAAGHGLLIQHPKWTQDHIAAAIGS